MLVIGSIVIIIIAFLGYMGFFSTITPEEKEEGGYVVVGIEVTGPYSQAGKYIGNVNDNLKKAGIICSKGFGIYYDDPKITPEEQCHSLVGCIIDKKDLEKIKTLNLTGLKIDSIPKAMAVVVEFPLKNMLSYMLGPIKAYPLISKHMQEKNYKLILSFEIYDNTQKKITFVMQYASGK